MMNRRNRDLRKKVLRLGSWIVGTVPVRDRILHYGGKMLPQGVALRPAAAPDRLQNVQQVG